jgi:hypothetical protein
MAGCFKRIEDYNLIGVEEMRFLRCVPTHRDSGRNDGSPGRRGLWGEPGVGEGQEVGKVNGAGAVDVLAVVVINTRRERRKHKYLQYKNL